MRLWLGLAVAALCIVPGASASFEASLEWCAEGAACDFRVRVWTACTELGAATSRYAVEFRWGASGVGADGPHNITVDLTPCATAPDGNATGAAEYDLIVDQAVAPGETPISALITFSSQNALCPSCPGTNLGTYAFTVVVRYHAKLMVQPSANVTLDPGQEAIVPVRIANLGNAQSALAFAIVGDMPDGWRVQLPPPVTIQSLQQGAATNEVTVPLVVRAGQGGVADFTLRITPSSTKGSGESGVPVDVSLHAEVGTASVPAAGIPMLLLLAGFCAGVQRAWKARRG